MGTKAYCRMTATIGFDDEKNGLQLFSLGSRELNNRGEVDALNATISKLENSMDHPGDWPGNDGLEKVHNQTMTITLIRHFAGSTRGRRKILQSNAGYDRSVVDRAQVEKAFRDHLGFSVQGGHGKA